MYLEVLLTEKKTNSICRCLSVDCNTKHYRTPQRCPYAQRYVVTLSMYSKTTKLSELSLTLKQLWEVVHLFIFHPSRFIIYLTVLSKHTYIFIFFLFWACKNYMINPNEINNG